MVKMDIYKYNQIRYNEKAGWEFSTVCEAQLPLDVAEYQSYGIKHATTDPGCAFPLLCALSSLIDGAFFCPAYAQSEEYIYKL